jgi:hypothetical protein
MIRSRPTYTFEIVGNFHLHTRHSDGTGTHQEVAWAAARAGLDVIICTDHNRWVPGKEGWYTHPETERKVLLLMGEEVHDTTRAPEANHYLCLGVDREMGEYAARPQALIDAVRQSGGAGFIAHPVERSAPLYDEPELPWVDWEVNGYTGIELWNYMSEFKSYLSSRPLAVLAAFFPSLFVSGPLKEALALWDKLLSKGQRVVAIGGADAHANVYSLGPLRRAIFPYQHLFRAVSTHLLLDETLSQDTAAAKLQVLNALRAGRAFVAYDLAGNSHGFRFSASNGERSAVMGGIIHLGDPIILRVTSPLKADLRLLKDGQQVAHSRARELTHQTTEPGVYRVEAYRPYRLKNRAWIFSNPIYVRPIQHTP